MHKRKNQEVPSRSDPLIDWALYYHRKGINVVKAYYKGKCPPKDGEWEKYKTERVPEAQYYEWFGPGTSYSNMSAISGPISGGLTALDFDSEELYEYWKQKYPEYTNLPTSKSGRGYHIFFRSTLTKDDTSTFNEIHIKAAGLVSLPPSMHKSSVRYEWIIPLPTKVAALPLIDPYKWDLNHLTDGNDGKDGKECIDGNEGVVKRIVKDCLDNLSVDTRDKIKKAIAETLPKEYGQRYNLLFLFARKLKKIDEIKKLSAEELMKMGIDVLWHEQALPNIKTKSLAMTQARFINAWEDAKYPPGEGLSLQIAWENAQKSKICMVELEDYRNEPIMQLLIKLCFELQRLAGPDDEWFIPTHKGSRLFGISYQWLAVLLNRLEEKIIKKTKKYTANKKCSRYIFIGPSAALLWKGTA